MNRTNLVEYLLLRLLPRYVENLFSTTMFLPRNYKSLHLFRWLNMVLD